tara:strand:- start:38 stop:484 length:447 start_codon:yes stop_codon:yes gene_type:complete
MTSKNMELARGYIASGEFNGNRVPQHIQNQIVKSYCDSNDLRFVLSRAEYWINGSTDCQLWAALKEDFKHIVFYSIWQLPERPIVRKNIYEHCIKNKITLHFAAERMQSSKDDKESFLEIEILIKSRLLILDNNGDTRHLATLKRLIA